MDVVCFRVRLEVIKLLIFFDSTLKKINHCLKMNLNKHVLFYILMRVICFFITLLPVLRAMLNIKANVSPKMLVV